jgi:class 3 adenylate cyclase
VSSAHGRILVVDDDLPNRIKLSLNLQSQGHTVALAENGSQALTMLQAEPFDLILLDILMPQMDGFQVLSRLQQHDTLRDLPVIVISALDEMDSVVACIEMGAEDHLTKPFDPVLLKARINASLEKKRLRDAAIQQLNFIREIFGKYVPKSIAAAMVEQQGRLEPMRTTATILYSDIEGFTSLSETIPPEQVFQMLNEYFPTVIEPITRYSGVVNHFQGDAMLATFNVPIDAPGHADNAVQAALEMQRAVCKKSFAGITLRTRIGINTGPVIAGNVGSGERFSYTVYGDAVNVAARLEQLNKKYGSLVLVSGSTVKRLTGTYPLVQLGETPVRGKQEPVQVFRLAD